MPLSWKWRLVLALMGVVLWSQPGMSAKIERFTDKEGTVHIGNAEEAEPSKPGWSPSPGRMTPPPQIFPGPVPQPQVVPSPVEPPEMPGDAADPMAEPPAAEASGEPAQPAQVAPGQQE